MNPSTRLKYETLDIVIPALIRALQRGGARAHVTAPRVVAVAYGTSNLGDMVCATPLFRAIKHAWPTVRLVVVGTKKNGELLAGNPDIDRYVPIAVFDEALVVLKDERVDVGVSVNSNPREIGMLYLAGARLITSFQHAGAGVAFNLLARLIVTVPYTPGRYIPRENLRLLEPLGIMSDDTDKVLVAHQDAQGVARAQLVKGGINPATPLVVVSPGAGQEFREWSPERFAEVARHAHARGAAIALIGLRAEAAGTAFLSYLKDVPVYDARGQSIEEMKALISTARAVVANDSGAVYIAEAFGVGAVVIAGIADPAEHLRPGPRVRVVVPPRSSAFVHALTSDPTAVDVAAARARLDAIPVSQVTAELDTLLLH